MPDSYPELCAIVLDTTDARGLAEFYRELLGMMYRPGDERPAVPQQLHLDLAVPTTEELIKQHQRALTLGATLLLDRFDDPDEQLYVYADPAGHPFCMLVGPTSVTPGATTK